MELESTALTLSSLQQKEELRQASSTRASDAKPEASTSSTRVSTSQLVASTSSPRASRKQLRDRKVRIFPSLFREIVILMIHSLTLCSLTLHSLSFLSSISSLNCTSLSFQSSFPIGWAPYLDEKDELLTTFGEQEATHNSPAASHSGPKLEKKTGPPHVPPPWLQDTISTCH